MSTADLLRQLFFPASVDWIHHSSPVDRHDRSPWRRRTRLCRSPCRGRRRHKRRHRCSAAQLALPQSGFAPEARLLLVRTPSVVIKRSPSGAPGVEAAVEVLVRGSHVAEHAAATAPRYDWAHDPIPIVTATHAKEPAAFLSAAWLAQMILEVVHAFRPRPTMLWMNELPRARIGLHAKRRIDVEDGLRCCSFTLLPCSCQLAGECHSPFTFLSPQPRLVCIREPR